MTKQRPRTPLTLAIRDIQPGEGFKVTCTYKHFPHKTNGKAYTACSGISTAHQTANRLGFKVSCKCREGMLYVLRYLSEEGYQDLDLWMPFHVLRVEPD